MSITNNFLPFAAAGGANVEDQATYSADSQRTAGNQPGVAKSSLNNKAIRQANAIASQVAQAVGDLTNTDVLDDADFTKLLSQIKATIQPLAPVYTKYTSGSGTHYLTYYFFIASGSATAAATYTNNTFTFTVSATIASGTILRCTGTGAPSASGTLTKASGTGDATITFYAVRAPISMEVEMVGGGGGGAAAATNSGNDGNDTTFGATATAGKGLAGSAATDNGGNGGTSTLGTNWNGVALSGAKGGGGAGAGATNPAGPTGGSSPFGGAGTGQNSVAGTNASANTGSGGGAGASGSNASGAGGAGGYIKALLSGATLLTSFAYLVGAGGAGGAAGTNAGGNGGSGVILLVENFQ